MTVSEIPLDTPDLVKSEVVGQHTEVEMVYEMTAEQAESILADLDRLQMDRDLNEDQQRIKSLCLRKLTEVRSEERHGAGEEREQTVQDRHQELREHIQIMKWRHVRS